jgi:hypothetical protein
MSTVAADWPSEPYKGLVYYGPEDRLLFSGRDHDVETCIHFLAASETRILLLHGQTGCGKSSFLRAGLIPGLEENAFGYLFLRDTAGSPLFIRSGADPLGRIAEHAFRFASQPVSVRGVTGVTTYDLSAACLGLTDIQAFVEECRRPGMMMKALRALSAGLPYTLVVILDQAEEVITFGDDNHDHRRQFFRFIREFGTSNFPVKFVLALRKDYSGEFIGLAQLGGAIDLRTNAPDLSPPNPQGDTVDRLVKSDIKIFLLAELSREEVLHAIELPTSKEKVDEGRSAPFEKYRFSYAPGVAQQIVSDLFAATSATAVLPVMQIVCRDLYNEAKVGKTEPPWQIDAALYARGGGLSGPVDRHITKSLKDSFGTLPAGTDVNAEEQRWREILFRLVRRESDGTVHTNIVDAAQLKAMAAEGGVKANVDDVTAYLTRSDVLLLRSVSVLAGTEGHEAKLFSLGHDAIGLVLQEWKLRALASQRVADEAKAADARIRRNFWRATVTGVLVIGFAAVIAVAVVTASAKGRAEQKHDVLLKIATANGRSSPMDAMYAAAHATVVADDMHRYELWKARDKKADHLLATLLAGMPRKTTFETDATPGAAMRAGTSIPLPKSIGFANVDANHVEITTGIADGEPHRSRFELEKTPDNSSAIWSGGEPNDGTVVLLRSSSPSEMREAGKSIDEVYVFTKDGRKFGPFSLDYFLRKTTLQGFAAPPVKKRNRSGDQTAPRPEDGFTQLDMSGSIVVLSKVKPGKDPNKGDMHIASFVFETERPASDPFRIGLQKDFQLDLAALDSTGFNDPLLLDDYMVVPVKLDHTQAAAQSPGTWAVRYDLRGPNGMGQPLKGFDALRDCDGKCDWELIPRESVDTLMVFASGKGAARSGTRSLEQAAQPDIDRYDRFLVFDARTDEAVAIDASAIRSERTACAQIFGQKDQALAPRKGSTTRLFVAKAKDLLLFGLQSDHSVDLIQIRNAGGHGTAACVGLLLYSDDVVAFRAAQDGHTLLAGGRNLGLSWSVAEKVSSKAVALAKQGGLLEAACEEGLRGHESPTDDWATTTYLGVQPVTLCDGTPARSAVKQRGSSVLPGVDLDLDRENLPGAFTKEGGVQKQSP